MQRAESVNHLKTSASISPRDEISPSSSPTDTVLGKIFASSLFKRAESPSISDSPRAWSIDIGPTIFWLTDHLPNEVSPISIRLLAYIATNYFYHVLPNKEALGHIIFLSLQEENLIPDFFSSLGQIIDSHFDKTKKRRLLEMGLFLLSHPQIHPFLTSTEISKAATPLLNSALAIDIDSPIRPVFDAIEMQKLAKTIIQKADELHSLVISPIEQIAKKTLITPEISLKCLEFISLYLQEEPFKIVEIMELIIGSRVLDPSGTLFPFTINQIHLLNETKKDKKNIYLSETIKKLLFFVYYWKHCPLNQDLVSQSDFIKLWDSIFPLLQLYPQAEIPQELQYYSNAPIAIHCVPYKKANHTSEIHPIWQDPSGVQKLQDSLLLYLLESWEMISLEDLLLYTLAPKHLFKAHAGRCNQIVCFIGTQILLCNAYEQAFTILKMLNTVQKKLIADHAYEVAFAIHSALNQGPVASVCKPFAHYGKLCTLFSEQDCLFTFKDNAKILREIQEQNPHVFEVSAIIMKDLNYFKENIPNYVKKSFLNIEKFKQLGRIYYRMALSKNHLSHFYRSKAIKVDDCIFSILKSQSRDSEEFLAEKYWKRAEEIHPFKSKKYWN